MSTFSDNLRTELGRIRPGTNAVCNYTAFTDRCIAELLQRANVPGSPFAYKDGEQHYKRWNRIAALAEREAKPYPSEITAIANALGVSESRLTVSREELEAEVRRLDPASEVLTENLPMTA